jgi:hypothetical protein
VHYPAVRLGPRSIRCPLLLPPQVWDEVK